MARDPWAYREVAVESVLDPASGRIFLRVVAGQAYSQAMRIQASRKLTDPALYPAGTQFLIKAKLTDRQGGEPFLFAYHGDPVVVLTRAQAKSFLDEYRRRRI
jgi:hypothetical protein